ncbi:hypothetical protein OIV83_004758 [Microbotryomycetes sp. JL201]|nr:hypothetical protein OIV83_004758 [Microbotryomycetes sp. JL201]
MSIYEELYYATWALVFGLSAWFVYSVATNPLRHVPGPFYTRITEVPLKIAVASGHRTAFIHRLHLRYGKTVRVSPRELSTIDLEALKTIYAQGSTCIKDEQLYESAQIDPVHTGVFSMAKKEDHARRRRILSPAFARATVEQHEQFITEKVQNLVAKLRAKKGETVDVLAMWRLFTADVVVMASLGTDLKMTESASVHPFVMDVDSAMTMSILRSAIGGTVYDAAQLIAKRVLSGGNKIRRAFEARERALHSFGAPLVNQYKATVGHDPNSKEIVSRLLGGMSLKDKPLSMGDVIADSINMLIAGTDTTSTTLTYLTYRLLSNPREYGLIHDELVAVFDEHDGAPSLKTLEKLPHLQRAIRETLRLHSAAPGTLPRITQGQGIMVEHYHIPAGYCVGAQAHSVHRDASIWGQDAEEWRPQRWESLTKQQEEAFRPTSCPGQTLAYIEATMAAAYIFRYFRGQLAPGFTEAQMDHRDFFLLVPAGHACKVVLTPVA